MRRSGNAGQEEEQRMCNNKDKGKVGEKIIGLKEKKIEPLNAIIWQDIIF